MIKKILHHLNFLIAQNTENPPRNITGDDFIFNEIKVILTAANCQVEIQDYGNGSVCLYAVKGNPLTLFNVHLDTVPVSDGWQRDPFKLSVLDGKAYGRGSCDIKGAAACLLTLADQVVDFAVLFSTDEEGLDSCCIDRFIDQNDLSRFEHVVVAEPTQCKAALSHRGYFSAQAQFSGISGHSSCELALTKNAIHKAGNWLSKALNKAHSYITEDNPLGIAFNTGYIQGGKKNNMIAEQTTLGFSFRVPSGFDNCAIFQQLKQNEGAHDTQWSHSMNAPAFPHHPENINNSRLFCQSKQLEIIESVDFWTEAALFSKAGFNTIVLGPGNIQQAHTVDEWVSLDDLNTCYNAYLRITDHAA